MRSAFCRHNERLPYVQYCKKEINVAIAIDVIDPAII